MKSKLGKNIGIAIGKNITNIKKICQKKFGEKKTKEILNKTGPIKTFQCHKKEDGLTLSLEAWKNFKKKNTNIIIRDIKNLIYTTESNRLVFPGNGYLFSSMANLNEEINIYDLNSGCTGFVDALKLANKLNGNTLIICSETYSKKMLYFQRSISTLFSDAASVFLFKKKDFQIIDTISFFKKNSFFDLTCLQNQIEMDGKKVFDFVLNYVFPQTKNFLKRNVDIKTIFFHQASKFVCDYIKKEFKSKNITIPSNLTNRGNTVSSSIPILINDYNKKNKLKINDKIMLVGFGVGLSMTAIIIKLKS